LTEKDVARIKPSKVLRGGKEIPDSGSVEDLTGKIRVLMGAVSTNSKQ